MEPNTLIIICCTTVAMVIFCIVLALCMYKNSKGRDAHAGRDYRVVLPDSVISVVSDDSANGERVSRAMVDRICPVQRYEEEILEVGDPICSICYDDF